eukprot:7305521-Alexandrium_andersonii.AAC.1
MWTGDLDNCEGSGRTPKQKTRAPKSPPQPTQPSTRNAHERTQLIPAGYRPILRLTGQFCGSRAPTAKLACKPQE